LFVFATELQQYLPFTVLKHKTSIFYANYSVLQQYLPFTVLKLIQSCILLNSCTYSCNSTYRLRY